jgi:hypothetical protein
MLKTLVFVGAIAALSTPALAGDIKISLVGKSAAEVHTAIVVAAEKVCAEENRQSLFSYSLTAACVRWSVARAEGQLPKQVAALH